MKRTKIGALTLAIVIACVVSAFATGETESGADTDGAEAETLLIMMTGNPPAMFDDVLGEVNAKLSQDLNTE